MQEEVRDGGFCPEDQCIEGSEAIRASYVLGDDKAMMVCLEGMLTQFLSEANDARAQGPFYCRTKPKIEISRYIDRIGLLVKALPVTYVVALIYIDRLLSADPSFMVNGYSVHRVLISAVMIASKYMEDHYFSNKHFSKVGGVSQEDMDLLQKQFLKAIDFNVFIDDQELITYAEKLDTFYEMLNPLPYSTNMSTQRPLSSAPQNQQP